MSGYSSIPIATPVAEVPPMVQVVAPASLNEGYTFEAVYNGKTFDVTVPKGGVKEGKAFAAPFNPKPAPVDSNPTAPTDSDPFLETSEDGPEGYWRDGICDCLKFGPIHPHFLNAFFCTPILTAQVMTRMKLDWLGREASDSQTRKTFRNVLIVFVTYLILSNTFSVSNATIYEIDEKGEIQVDPPPKPSTSLLIINKIVYISFAIYALIIMLRTRRTVRERYQIPEVYCPNGMEDLFCSVFCGSCAVAQMARHTADYGHERSLCCSTTGLPNFNPVMIV